MKDLIGFVVLVEVLVGIILIVGGKPIEKFWCLIALAGVGSILAGIHYGYQQGIKAGLRQKESL